MPDDLYERDILEWSIVQADRLRRLRTGERPNDVDWDNLIDEVEAVGRNELRATTSPLTRALEHLMTIAAWPGVDPERHWRTETVVFLRNARRAFAPSMRQRIELAELYPDALAAVLPLRISGREPASLVKTCPFTLDELLDPEIDIAAAVNRLRAQPT